MRTTQELIDVLLDQVAALRPIYEEHTSDYDQLLPHVLLGDVTRFIVDLHKQSLTKASPEQTKETLSSILRILEEALKSGDEQLKELIVVSFLENLEQDDKDYESLKKQLGEHLKRYLLKIEEWRQGQTRPLT